MQRFRSFVAENTVVLALLVGVLTATAGLALKWIIEQIHHLLAHWPDGWFFILSPFVGIVLTSLFIRHVVRDDISHGVTRILFAIARKQSHLRAHNCWSSLLASAVTIGFGGSVGAEAPIVLTGSSLGSNLGRLFNLDSRKLMLLLGCGAAGAVAGIFKAPIAGLVFVLEVLMIDLTMASLLPLLVSCVTAAAISFAFTGMQPLFSFTQEVGFVPARFPAYIMLGGASGLLSLYFTRATDGLESLFRRISSPTMKLGIGGAIVVLLIWLFPPLRGEGYDTVNTLIQTPPQLTTSLIVGYCAILLLKVFATAATNCTGGCGGIFAPTLFLGCITGFLFASAWNALQPFGITVSAPNFAMLGMAGLMSGVMHAPLTGIFLIAELTGGYGLFMPLMTVSVCSYLTIRAFQPHSLYAMRLARRGELITHHKDHAILTLMSMDSVLDRYSRVLHPEQDLSEVTKQIALSSHNVFPVVDTESRLLGILYIDDIRHLMFRTELYHRFTVQHLMTQPMARLTTADTMDVVVRTFERTGAWTLPVTDLDGHFVGFIRKSKVFTMYRQMMADISNE